MSEDTEVKGPKRTEAWLELAGGGGVLVRAPQAPPVVRQRQREVRLNLRLPAEDRGEVQ